MGRPPKFKNEAELQAKLIEYFAECDTKKWMPNKAGLCVFLGILRERYSELRKKYPHTIKGCDNLIEQTWVQRLGGNSPTGAIFYLKNAFKEHYKDRHENDITTGGKPISIYGGRSISGHNGNKKDIPA